MQRKMRLSPTGEGAPLVGPSGAPTGDEPYHSSAPRESLWYHSAFIMMAEVMGMGLLGLPHAMANLGWILGLSAAILFGLAAAYAALLLSRLRLNRSLGIVLLLLYLFYLIVVSHDGLRRPRRPPELLLATL